MKKITKESEIITNTHLIYFGASWCGPCKSIKPSIEELSSEISIPIYDADIETMENLSTQFKIKSVPTLVFIKNSVEIKRWVGRMSKLEILAEL